MLVPNISSNRWSCQLLAVLFFLFSFVANAQVSPTTYIGVRTYLAKPGKAEAYESMVKSHTRKVMEGAVVTQKYMAWYFYKVLMSDRINDYNYVSVTVTSNFNDLVDNPVSFRDMYTKSFTGSKDMTYDQYNGKMSENRTEVSFQVFALRAGINPNVAVSKYVQVDFMKPMPGKTAEYIQTEKEIFYPIHQERIKLGALTDWGLYEKLLPFSANAENDFVTANFFNDLKSLIDPKYEEAFNYIPNNTNFIIMSDRVDQIRKMVRSDIWKLVDHVDSKSK